MNSLVYFYSKFTEEFLLLSASAVFALLSIYLYQWVILKRRLGVARSQIPSTVVKSYLNQLIHEAEFVRKQLFGMTDSHQMVTPFQGSGVSFTAPSAEGNQPISPDLMTRINALEGQLKDKESLVVNINIEKTKLLAEIENLKANQGTAAAGPSGNQEQLVQKIKNLEARLEEYALFEEDLANLKRLQQENAQLKKKLAESGVPTEAKAPALSVVPDLPVETAPPPVTPQPVSVAAAAPAPAPVSAPVAAADATTLDQSAIDSLLNGAPAVPPESTTSDQFEKLVDSVETSLEAPAITPEATQPAPVQAAAPASAPTPAPAAASESGAPPSAALANKTDEDLLKEFENLLNS